MATTSWSQSAGMTSDTDTDNVTDDLTPTDTSYTQRSGMVSDTDVDNIESYSEQAEASKDAAAASAAAAALSETAAETAETNAETAETNAAASAATATTKASEASTSAATATTKASEASTSASNAATSATAAQTAQTAAETAETNAETAETNAAASASAASTSETNAATSETNASTSATSASTSATTATTQATSASTSAATAATSEANAATSETNAATSATNAANSATTASTQATNAATSATNAATSETNAATSATAAASSATSAQASKDAALAALDNFDDRYLGQKASDPTVDNDGDALISGALYFNSTDDVMKVYEGSLWVAAYASLSGALLSANNLSDLASAALARTNLGLGTAATTASSDYATAAQGTLADSAVQPNDSPSFGSITVTGTVDGRDIAADGAKLDGIEASADVTDTDNVTSAGALMDSEVVNLAQVKAFDSGDYATAAQGTLADSAVQPNDSPTFAGLTTTGTVQSTVSTTGDDNFKAISTGGGNYRIYPDDATTANPTWLHQSNSSEEQAWVIGGVERMRIDSGGRVTMPYQPCFSATGSGTLSWSAGSTITKIVPLTSVPQNIGGHFNTSTYRFTAPVAGNYFFSVKATQTGSAGGPAMIVTKNGAVFGFEMAIGYSTAYHSFGGEVIVPMAANDWVDMRISNNNSVAMNIDLGRTSLSGFLIG